LDDWRPFDPNQFAEALFAERLAVLLKNDTPREGSKPGKHSSGLVGLSLWSTTSFAFGGLLPPRGAFSTSCYSVRVWSGTGESLMITEIVLCLCGDERPCSSIGLP
jgi:hypothetical protein